MKEYLWGVLLSKERVAGSQESFKDKGRIGGLWLAMQKCWFLENSTTISMYKGHGNVAPRRCHILLFCFHLWLEQSNGLIHLPIEILHLFIQNLGEFGIILKQGQTLGHLCLYNVLSINYPQITSVWSSLWNPSKWHSLVSLPVWSTIIILFSICIYENLVLSKEMITVQLTPWKSWK